VVFRRIFLPPSVGESRRQMIKKGDLKKTNQRFNHKGPIKSVIRVAVHG
jgi:hypothetical protein